HLSYADLAGSFCAAGSAKVHEIDASDQEDEDGDDDEQLDHSQTSCDEMPILHFRIEVFTGDRLREDLAIESLSLLYVFADDVTDLIVEGCLRCAGFQQDISAGIGDLPSYGGRVPAELVDEGPGKEVLEGKFGIGREVSEDAGHLELPVAVDEDGLTHRVFVAEEVFRN